jgi:hypothetical protein
MQQRNVGRVTLGEGEIMRNEDDRLLLFVIEHNEQSEQSIFRRYIEIIRRFIENKKSRTPDQGTGNQRSLTLAARKSPIITFSHSRQSHFLQCPNQSLLFLVATNVEAYEP